MANDTGLLKTNLHELVKKFVVYDGNSRPTDVYEARANAQDGDPCLRTQYAYVSPTSTLVEKQLEVAATWDADWDI